MIPKIIHYCWYGRGPKSSTILKCIDSWKKFCPDYEIKEWNEDNSPMGIPWMADAYKHQKYAFVADYMRFWVLNNEGGVYMDTDMLLVKNLDSLLDNVAFLGLEDKYNANMAILGSMPGLQIHKEILCQYNNTCFDLVHPPIITRFVTPLLQKRGLTEVDAFQLINDGICVYPSAYFYPIHYSQEFNISEVYSFQMQDTVGIHLWNKSWEDEFGLLERGDFNQGFRIAYARIKRTPILPWNYWKKLLKYTCRYCGLWKI